MVRNILVAAVLFLGSSPIDASALASTDVTGAQGVDEAWRMAIVNNDLDAITACYSPDAILWLPDALPARGQEESRRAYSVLLSLNTVKDVVLTNAQYETRGELSAGWGDISITMLPKVGGDSVRTNGRFSVIAKQLNGRWVYIVDHSSAGPPATGIPQTTGSTAESVQDPLDQSGTLHATGKETEETYNLTGSVRPPERTKFIPPKYPEGAKHDRTQGKVVLEIVVDENGDVESEEVLKSNIVFDAAAIQAVRQWKYKPALKDGKPVRVWLTVTVDFSLR